jgi:serine/threonine protein kinase/Flp pilus assembly protein TadD
MFPRQQFFATGGLPAPGWRTNFGTWADFEFTNAIRLNTAMDSDRWRRIQELFHGAAGLPEPERQTYLNSQCGSDGQLMEEVKALLAEDSREGSLLDHDVALVAHRIVADGDALPSVKFGPYRIVKALGEGGMGVVYLAEREDLGSHVAIKVLRDAWLSPGRRERFTSEQRTLAQLNHPSIARLYDANTLDDGTPWFVMEYVEGVPINQYCREQKCSIPERLKLVRAVCEAVQYAHQNAVIHRDLKPSNILVKPDGTVRLLDFGIAKQLESLDRPVDQTRTGLRLMTPAYASPEQIRGERVGIQTDVYSLGVVLYELLAGRLPFDLSTTTPAAAEKILLEREPEKPSAVAGRPVVSSGGDAQPTAPQAGKSAWADLDVLCLTAMHKDTARRYSSVEALVRDIDRYLASEPLEARPDSISYRLGKFERRHRLALSAASLTLAAVMGMAVFYTVRLRRARNAAQAETARTKRIQQFMQNLFSGGDEAEGPSDNLRVVTLLDRGVQEAKTLGSDPAVQADLYETLGGLYEKLGKFDEADQLLREALDRRKSLYGPDNEEVAKSLVDLGLLRADQARYTEAEKDVREGLAMAKRHLPPNQTEVAKATFALGTVLEDRGDYAGAIAALEKAARIQSASGASSQDLAASLSELANSHFYAGHLNESEMLNLRVLEMHRRLYGPGHPLVADTLINLGAIEYERGHYSAAEKFDRQAFAITRAWYGADHPETASAMTILGRALVSEHRYGEAETLLRQALAIQEKTYGPVHPRVASALNDLGRAAEKEGKLNDAAADFTRMAAIYRKVYGNKHYLVGIAGSNLGSVYMARKQYARAEQLFRQAVAIFSETLSPQHENTAIARIKLGHVLVLERRYAAAKTESLAGYQILVKQTSPTVSWLQDARADLVTEFDAFHQPEKAEHFRNHVTYPGSGIAATAKNK